MNKKDKILLKQGAMVTADQIVSSIPALNIAWGLCKALYGAGMELRHDRVLEFVEMIHDHPEIFTEMLLNDEKFQDGFVYMLEQYIRERNRSRRTIFRNIFFGFSKANDKDNFPLERFAHVLSQLHEVDIELLTVVKYKGAITDISLTRPYSIEYYQVFGNTYEHLENIVNLINLGILCQDSSARFGPQIAPFVSLSSFGKEFINFVVASEEK